MVARNVTCIWTTAAFVCSVLWIDRALGVDPVPELAMTVLCATKVFSELPIIAVCSLSNEEEQGQEDVDVSTMSPNERAEYYNMLLYAERIMPICDMLNSQLPIAVDVVSTGTGKLVKLSVIPIRNVFIDRHYYALDPPPHPSKYWAPRLGLSAKERKDIYVDISSQCGALESGNYVVTLYPYHDFQKPLAATSEVSIEVQQFDPTVWAGIRQIASGLPESATAWKPKDWVAVRMDLVGIKSLPPAVVEAIAPYAYLNGIIHGASESELTWVSNAFPRHLEPLKMLLQLEHEIDSKNMVKAAITSQQIKAAYPSIAWSVDLAEKGKGLVYKARRIAAGKPVWPE